MGSAAEGWAREWGGGELGFRGACSRHDKGQGVVWRENSWGWVGGWAEGWAEGWD